MIAVTSLFCRPVLAFAFGGYCYDAFESRPVGIQFLQPSDGGGSPHRAGFDPPMPAIVAFVAYDWASVFRFKKQRYIFVQVALITF